MEIPVNKVSQSGIVVIDPSAIVPGIEVVEFDLKEFLFKGLILREKEFRMALKSHDWEKYRNQKVAVFCSTEALIQHWAWVLVQVKLNDVDAVPYFGTPKNAFSKYILDAIEHFSVTEYQNKKVVLKGCGEKHITGEVYFALAEKLLPIVDSLMYGEPCSTVPMYKRKK